MTKDIQPKPNPLPRDPQQLLDMGLRLGRAITALVFDRPLSEREAGITREPLPCSRTLRRVKGDRS